MIGRVRAAVAALPAQRPGRDSAQIASTGRRPDAIDFSTNESPFPVLESVRAAICAAAGDAGRYPDHGATTLRAELADWLGIAQEQVTVGCGSVGLLHQLFMSYVERGDEVVFPRRSFEAYPVYTKLVGGTAVTPSLVDHAFDLDAVAAAVTDRTKVVVLANPNNPTGTAVSVEDILWLLSRLSRDTLVVLDEAYRDFAAPSLGDAVHDLVGQYPNTVILRTFSKAHSLAGLRVGYAISDPSIIAALDKTLIPFSVNIVAQAAALAALGAADEILERVRKIVSERDRVSSLLRRAGWALPATQANFVYIPLGDQAGDVYLALERRGVSTRPFPREGIRVTIRTAAENDRFLETFQDVAG